MNHESNYDKRPAVTISADERDCARGWAEVINRLRSNPSIRRIAIECYPGVFVDPFLEKLVSHLAPELLLDASASMFSPQEVEAKFASMLGEDPVFACMEPHDLDEFFDPALVQLARREAAQVQGRIVAIGTGATIVLPDYE